MIRRRRLAGSILAAMVGLGLGLSSPRPARADDDDPPPRFSLPLASDRAIWKTPGFRLQLGVAYGWLSGLGGAPSGRLLGPVLRVGERLDAEWSLMGSFEYLAASAPGQLSGLRFAGTIEPTYHFSESWSLAVGMGFGGMVEGRTGRVDPTPLGSTLDTSYTFPDASTPLPSCNGVGVAGLARTDYLFVLGPRSSMGLELEVDGQWTGCEQPTGHIEPDTAAPIVRRQWWPALGGTLALVISWR